MITDYIVITVKNTKLFMNVFIVICVHAWESNTLARMNLYDMPTQARNQDFMWGGANEAKADPTTEMYFLSSDPFI